MTGFTLMLNRAPFVLGMMIGLLFAFGGASLGHLLGFPKTASPGRLDLTDFAFIGALVACGWMTTQR